MEKKNISYTNRDNEEQELIMPKLEVNKKIIIIGICLGLILLLAVSKVAGKALNKSKNQAKQEQQEKILNDTMLEAQQQLGDEFYNAASNGAPIPGEQADGQDPINNPQMPGELSDVNPSMGNEVAAEQKNEEKLVTVNLSANVGRVDPFVPTVNYGKYTSSGLPSLPNVSYPAPPTELVTNEPAIKLMETTISGILYDAISPSAIIKVEGQDHLVRKGDRINGYKILNITKDRVVVQNGTNVYRATVGETITTTKGNVNFNTIDHLTNKFGGSSAPKGTTMIQIN